MVSSALKSSKRATRESPLLQQVIQGTVRHYLAGFLVERRSRGLAPRTLGWYQGELELFAAWLDEQGAIQLEEVTPDLCRQYLLQLGARRKPGGVHAAFRAMRAFFSWVEDEFDEENLRSPMRKVSGPKVNRQAKEGVAVETIRAMIAACDTELARRDKLILMMLFDTGVRASELLALDIQDVDQVLGSVDIRHGKGDKRRTVFIGRKTRRELRSYLKMRGDLSTSPSLCSGSAQGRSFEDALFVNDEGDRLQYEGLRKIVIRRAEAAGVKAPGLHDFRRAFAVTMLRNNVDVIKLAEMMGHTSLEMTRKYVRLVDDDLRLAHSQAGPVDKSL